jgi:lipid-A-disaccharide synthase
MKPKTFMVIAGEASGDMLAAELVAAIRREFNEAALVLTTDFQPLHTSLEPRFFGAGGAQMAAAGVELAFDMTAHSVTGISDVLKNLPKFRGFLNRLYHLALDREPDAIICVDFSGFNRRVASAIKQFVRAHSGCFHDWNPKLIQYVSPQVWASRPGRAHKMKRDFDLLLSTFPFEKEWYRRHTPGFRVEFVGNPIVERHLESEGVAAYPALASEAPRVLLLPGSRVDELRRHLPVMIGAMEKMQASVPGLRASMVLPNDNMAELARRSNIPSDLRVQIGGLGKALAETDVAIASTGTVTMECAYFGVPTVAIYKTSWMSYAIAKRIAKVKYVAMPNLLANEEIMPEFIQHAASAGNIAGAALEFLRDEKRRNLIKLKLRDIMTSLGGPGASQRAAKLITSLVNGANNGETSSDSLRRTS